jgi:hypothetical protein
VRISYKLIEKGLPHLYYLSGSDYDTLFTRILDVILQQARQYKAPQYWSQRSLIGTALNDEFKEQLRNAHAN